MRGLGLVLEAHGRTLRGRGSLCAEGRLARETRVASHGLDCLRLDLRGRVRWAAYTAVSTREHNVRLRWVRG